MKKISFSAPGSVILSGEYGMNFGKPALILAVDSRIQAIVTEEKKRIAQDAYIVRAAETVQNYLKANTIEYKDRLFKVLIRSKLPKSEVFGYSSALYTALIASLFAFYSQTAPSQETVSLLAYQLEKKLHKITYGIRTSASSFGGLIYFRKEFEFLRTISLLKIKVPKIIEKYLVINTPRQHTQRFEIENAIGKGYNTDTRQTERLLSELEKITKRTVMSFVKEDLSLYIDCVKKEKQLLQKLNPRNMQILKTQNISLTQDIKGAVCEQI